MEEKYTAEVSAQKIIERIKHLLAQGVPRPLKRKWVERGFGGTLWNVRETKAIDFEEGFKYLIRTRTIKPLDDERFELTPYFELFAPKYHKPPPLPVQVSKQIENEADNMKHCYRWLYIFENMLREFVLCVLREKYGDRWYEKISQGIRKEIERNKERWSGGIPARSPLEFTTLNHLHRIINSNWSIFKDKIHKIDQPSFIESMKRIESFRNTIAHSRMLTEEEFKVFYYEIGRLLRSIFTSGNSLQKLS